MTITYVDSPTEPIYGTSTETSLDVVWPAGILADDLLTIRVFARRTLTTPAGFSATPESPTTGRLGTTREVIYYKTAVGTESGTTTTVTQAEANRMGVFWSIHRSTEGALSLVDDAALDPIATTETITAPTVTHPTAYLALAVASNVYADTGDNLAEPSVASSSDAAWIQRNTLPGGLGDNRLGAADAILTGGASPTLVFETRDLTTNNWGSLVAAFAEPVVTVTKGVSITFTDEDTDPAPDETGISWAFWNDPATDVTSSSLPAPDHRGDAAAIVSGVMEQAIPSSNAIDANGLLVVRKRNSSTPAASPAFIGEVPIVDIS